MRNHPPPPTHSAHGEAKGCARSEREEQKKRTNSHKQLALMWMDYRAALCLYIFKMFRDAIREGSSRGKDHSVVQMTASAGASSRAICLVEQIYGHGEFFPANLLTLPVVSQKQNWGSTYHMVQMAAEGIRQNSFFDMNYLSYWCRLRSDGNSESDKRIGFCKEYIAPLCIM